MCQEKTSFVRGNPGQDNDEVVKEVGEVVRRVGRGYAEHGVGFGGGGKGGS